MGFAENNQMMSCTRKQLICKKVSTRHDKNFSNASTGQKNAKQFENVSSDPIGNENRAATIEKQATMSINTPAHFCMQDTIDIFCTTTREIVFYEKNFK